MLQEGGTQLARLDQFDRVVAQNGEDDAGQPCPAPDVEPQASRVAMTEQLGGVDDMAGPDCVEGGGCDQVLARRLIAEQIDKLREPRFT